MTKFLSWIFVSVLLGGTAVASESPRVVCEVYKYRQDGSGLAGILGDVDLTDGRTLIESRGDGLSYEAIFEETADDGFAMRLVIFDTEKPSRLVKEKAGILSSEHPVLSLRPYDSASFVCKLVKLP